MGTGEPGVGRDVDWMSVCISLAIIISHHRVRTSRYSLWPKPPVLLALPPLKGLPIQCLTFLSNLFLAQIKLSLHSPEAEYNWAVGEVPHLWLSLRQHLWMDTVVCLHNGLHLVMNHLCTSPSGRQFVTQNALVVAYQLWKWLMKMTLVNENCRKWSGKTNSNLLMLKIAF